MWIEEFAQQQKVKNRGFEGNEVLDINVCKVSNQQRV